jgi:hypothetical protein
MKLQDPMKTVNSLMWTRKIEKNDRCCGESGTLGDASGHLHAGALPQGRGNHQGRDKLRADGFTAT